MPGIRVIAEGLDRRLRPKASTHLESPQLSLSYWNAKLVVQIAISFRSEQRSNQKKGIPSVTPNIAIFGSTKAVKVSID